MHKEIRYEIKDGKIYTYKIEEISNYSKLLRYKPNYRKITDDIIFVDNGKHKDYLLLSFYILLYVWSYERLDKGDRE